MRLQLKKELEMKPYYDDEINVMCKFRFEPNC